MKKAQSISINTIIIAAIAMTVMILIILITTNNLTNFGKASVDCESNGGICVKQGECAKDPYLGKTAMKSCNYEERTECCISPYTNKYLG